MTLPTTLKLGQEQAEDLLQGRYLVVMSHDQFATRELPESGVLTIGREGQVQLTDPLASRRHARLLIGPDEILVEDLESVNGTRVRDTVIAKHQPVPVAIGEGVTIGSTLLLLCHSPPTRDPRGGVARAPGKSAAPNDGPVHSEADDALLARSEAMKAVLKYSAKLAATSSTVVLLGETGTGKSALARWIHERSARASAMFLMLNCASLPETLVESELFGYERGAFSGAHRTKPGLLELAKGGTFFLDEVGELPLPVQAKLLSAIQERKIWRLGGREAIPIDVRFIAATHRNLEREVAEKRFRQDLYYRICVAKVTIPPLRERIADIAPLVERFLRAMSRANGRAVVATLAPEAMARLEGYAWPGNIRELENVLQRLLIQCEDSIIGELHLPEEIRRDAALALDPLPRESFANEREWILAALAACHGHQTRAAERLGLSRSTLSRLMQKHAIRRHQDP